MPTLLGIGGGSSSPDEGEAPPETHSLAAGCPGTSGFGRRDTHLPPQSALLTQGHPVTYGPPLCPEEKPTAPFSSSFIQRPVCPRPRAPDAPGEEEPGPITSSDPCLCLFLSPSLINNRSPELRPPTRQLSKQTPSVLEDDHREEEGSNTASLPLTVV